MIEISGIRREIMEIEILQMIEGARKARGCAVIIDVFRAFSFWQDWMVDGHNQFVAVDETEVNLLYIYDKAERSNITAKEIDALLHKNGLK